MMGVDLKKRGRYASRLLLYGVLCLAIMVIVRGSRGSGSDIVEAAARILMGKACSVRVFLLEMAREKE